MTNMKNRLTIDKTESKEGNLTRNEMREEVDTFGSIVGKRPINQSTELLVNLHKIKKVL